MARAQPRLAKRLGVILAGSCLVECELAASHAIEPNRIELDYQVKVTSGLAEPLAQVGRPSAVEPILGPYKRGAGFGPAGDFL